MERPFLSCGFLKAPAEPLDELAGVAAELSIEDVVEAGELMLSAITVAFCLAIVKVGMMSYRMVFRMVAPCVAR